MLNICISVHLDSVQQRLDLYVLFFKSQFQYTCMFKELYTINRLFINISVQLQPRTDLNILSML